MNFVFADKVQLPEFPSFKTRSAIGFLIVANSFDFSPSAGGRNN
jgi:hypothetical protein